MSPSKENFARPWTLVKPNKVATPSASAMKSLTYITTKSTNLSKIPSLPKDSEKQLVYKINVDTARKTLSTYLESVGCVDNGSRETVSTNLPITPPPIHIPTTEKKKPIKRQ